MFEVLFTKDGILNPFPIEPVVVCHPPKIWLVHLFFFFLHVTRFIVSFP